VNVGTAYDNFRNFGLLRHTSGASLYRCVLCTQWITFLIFNRFVTKELKFLLSAMATCISDYRRDSN
jgi:hypothetical protein